MRPIFSFIIISISLFLTSCKEVLNTRVVIDSIDTTYLKSSASAAQSRIVLFEEFTGTSCVNCPEGHARLKELTDLYGSRMAVVGLHFGSLSAPAHGTGEDLRTDFAEAIGTDFGVSSMPSAAIDRKSVGGVTILGRDDWRQNFINEMDNPVKVNVTTQTYIDPNSNNKILELNIEFLENYSDDVKYSISLTEDKIIAPQKSGSIVIDEYEQEHVLRKMYTNALGNSLSKVNGSTVYEKGRVYLKKIVIGDLDAKWKPADMNFVCFVTNQSTKEVLQTSTIKFQ